jgi:ribosome-associated translation inhibitor RaiA
MDSSTEVETYIHEKLAKIEKFLEHEQEPIFLDLTMTPSKTREHPRVELRIKSPHYRIISEYEHDGVGFYDCLDRVIDIAYRDLLEAKRRLTDKHKHGAPPEKPFQSTNKSDDDIERIDFEDFEEDDEEYLAKDEKRFEAEDRKKHDA